MSKVKLTRRRIEALLAIVFASLLCAAVAQRLAHSAEDKSRVPASEKRATNERDAAIEAASFARTEFFGAQALVPYPTAEARNRLASVLEKYPNEPQVSLRLSRLDEKLGRFEESERELQSYVELQPDKQEALETLASFFDRRAQFEKEAATFERLLDIVPAEQSAQIFGRLIELARTHRLESYLKPEFYEKYIAKDAASFEIIEQLLDKLTEEKNYTEALQTLRQYKDHYPERRSYLLEKEVSILVAMKRDVEAEGVYQKAFDPFWPQDASERFYSFLSDHDRFRAYGHELVEAFRRNPADFQVAVRLIHYRNYNGEKSPRIIGQLEQARAARSITWQPEELATIARILIAEGDGDTASRFLYTLYAQNELKPGSPLRARVLYQLFELLSDAKDERLALTRGDLTFYQDIATSDPHPGMLGGVLSLILSDTDPASELKTQEHTAARYFNRAAAFRIFNAYRQEYPTSPELAQMYLDIVRLYAASEEPKVAYETLTEFEERYENAPHYAEVALKLADCYITLGRYKDERAVYQRVMDSLGRKRSPNNHLVPALGQTSAGDGEQAGALNINSEPTEIKPSVADYPPQSNRGIDPSDANTATDRYGYSESRYRDYLSAASSKSQSDSAKAKDEEDITYASVLERFVASLSREKRNDDILALYTNEIRKYPDEQGLYEQMLEWLGQTNLFEDQLKVYKEALLKFPTSLWRDRLARWYIRRERKEEFETYSRQLLEQLGDQETQDYLNQFVGSNSAANASSFDAQLYLGLYTLAHERFPHNLDFVRGLLKFYGAHASWNEWRSLMAEYYFVSREIRDEFLSHLASRNELRAYLDRARERCKAQANDDGERVLDTLPYKLFRADAAAHLSNYEEAIDAYRELNRLYPNTPEFAERLISFTRSLGERNPKFLEEAAAVSHEMAESFPASRQYRTRAGEVQAELGNYDRARGEWEQLIQTGKGEPETYLETATVYWDYFQYADALRAIEKLREQLRNPVIYAFQTGAILEAEHRTTEAISEYVKALDYYGSAYDDAMDQDRAKRRLVKLYKRAGVPAQLQLAFERERSRRRPDSSSLVLDYADLLKDAGDKSRAAALLKQEIARNDSREFLVSARNILDAEKDEGVRQLALKRLVAVTKTPRFSISYRLQLAADAEQRGNRLEAQAALHNLVESFPTNYGVLDEADGLYWRMGFREDALRVLEEGMRQGKGRFYYIFGRKLAARLTLMNRLPAAERVLTELHSKDLLNTEVFHELARIYLHTSNTDALKKAFHQMLTAINEQDLDRRELHEQAAELRKQMIDAFTRLKDYRSAIEQHIEIINREPDNEESVDAAIDYARRYGGADTLLDYYRQTAQAAYKNYRWNVVLARIYVAKNDLQSAAQNYRAAIANQPEMVELYDALADIYTRMKNYEAALEALNHASELTNDDPQYIRRTVEVLLKAGRRKEAEEARQKLPDAIAPKEESAVDQFAEAAQLQRTDEKSKAVAAYREAFNTLLADPLAHELKAAEITGYVQTVRDEERLDQITERLWQLRERLIEEAERKDSTRAGEARASLKVLDGALPEAVGQIASQQATGDELSALFSDFNRRIETALSGNDTHETLALLQNLSHRSGFGVLEEKILITQKEAAYLAGSHDAYRQRLQVLVEFYKARGAYRQVIALMEAERAREVDTDSYSYILRITAENARLTGEREKELQALRENYRRVTGSLSNQASGLSDEMVERYLEALYENGDKGKDELRDLAQQASPFQLQLVNFLLAHGESSLAHEAIERAPFSKAWKLSRHAGASLALKDFNPQNEAYFSDALQLKSIGELILEKPDASKQPVGDDWFRLTLSYGQWLYQSQQDGAVERGRRLLSAMIENRPHDQGEQAKLGRSLLERKDYKGALEHLELALEMNPQDNETRAALGSAAFLSGDEAKGLELWAEIIKDKQPELQDCELYLRTLHAHGLASEARERIFPLIAERISDFGDYENDYPASPYGAERQKKLESLLGMIRALADSFREGGEDSGAGESHSLKAETARAQFFYRLSEAAKNSNALPQMLIKESLVAREHLGEFYQLLIKRSSPLNSYERDYDYTAKLYDTWSADEAEDALDQENGYKISEPQSERIRWQKEYLDYLIARHQWAAARSIVNAVGAEISRRYARPAWLRLASLRLEIVEGGEAKALAGLRRFIGIEGASSSTVVNAPSLERLNLAVRALKDEGLNAQADQLLEAAYTREIALENYGAHAFVGLARLAFGRGDANVGLKLLQTMVALSDNETREVAAAELASWPNVKAYAADGAKQEVSEMENTLDRKEALRLAAETASAFGEFDAGINYRRQLYAISPEDETNHLELVQLLAEQKKYDEVIDHLAQIICERRASRQARWQAIWLASMIGRERDDLLTKLKERARELDAKDVEMLVAIDALSLSSAGRTDEAVKLINAQEAANPNPYLSFFGALLEKRGQSADAQVHFIRALVAKSDERVSEAFLFEENPLRQIIRLYASKGEPHAALLASELEPTLKESNNTASDEQVDSASDNTQDAQVNLPESSAKNGVRYQTLLERASEIEIRSRTELLGLLSQAAEQVGDLGRAIGLERARLKLLPQGAERQAAEARVDQLVSRKEESLRRATVKYKVDQSLVASR
jgi:tetratricopeptide (TPR) repeat protein/cytochrome c-type biogenesis protein CcmH/NrfG